MKVAQLAVLRPFPVSGWQDSNLRPPHPKCIANIEVLNCLSRIYNLFLFSL